MTWTNQRPTNKIVIPTSTPQVVTRMCGSFFFSWSKINISHSSPFDLTVRAKTRFPQRPIIQRVGQAIEEAKPKRRHRSAHQAHDQPLPEREPADERLGLRIEQEKQG